jgi:hypothetical protein
MYQIVDTFTETAIVRNGSSHYSIFYVRCLFRDLIGDPNKRVWRQQGRYTYVAEGERRKRQEKERERGGERKRQTERDRKRETERERERKRETERESTWTVHS